MRLFVARNLIPFRYTPDFPEDGRVCHRVQCRCGGRTGGRGRAIVFDPVFVGDGPDPGGGVKGCCVQKGLIAQPASA